MYVCMYVEKAGRPKTERRSILSRATQKERRSKIPNVCKKYKKVYITSDMRILVSVLQIENNKKYCCMNWNQT